MERVVVVIRSPVSSILDVRLECELDWRVFRIKQKISELFPGNPSVQSQKLVYAGKLLEDQASLRDVLRMEDDCSVHTIHLVCRLPARQQQQQQEQHVENRTNQQGEERRGQQEQQQQQEGEGVVLAGQEDQARDWLQYISGMSSQHTNINSYNSSQQLSEENLQQMAWMQQVYGQYLNQYMIYMNSSGALNYLQPGLGVDTLHQVQNGQGGGGGGGGEGQGGGGGVLPPVLDAAGAGGGGAAAFQQDEEEGGARNRDILDWFYISSRVLVLMSIVYFYSSLARFLLVGSLFLFLYALQMGLLQGQHREQRNNIQQEVDNIREEGGGTRDQGGQLQQEEEEPDIITVAATFILTFFSSLIPDHHNQAVV